MNDDKDPRLEEYFHNLRPSPAEVQQWSHLDHWIRTGGYSQGGRRRGFALTLQVLGAAAVVMVILVTAALNLHLLSNRGGPHSPATAPRLGATPQPSQSSTPPPASSVQCQVAQASTDSGPAPNGRGDAIAFDGARAQIVYLVTSGSQTQTWTWDGTAWTQQHPAQSPPPGTGTAAAYDAARRVVVVYGGSDPSTPFPNKARTDTWTWDGTNWTQQRPAHVPQIQAARAVFDEARNQVVLVGAAGTDPAIQTSVVETWVWNGSDWSQRTTPSGIGGYLAALGYDAGSRRVVLYGGVLATIPGGDVWTFDGSTWTRIAQRPAGPSSYQGDLAYDSSRQGFLYAPLDAGSSPCTNWFLKGGSWTGVPNGTHPQADRQHLVRDASRNRNFLIADEQPGNLARVWTWNGSGWQRA